MNKRTFYIILLFELCLILLKETLFLHSTQLFEVDFAPYQIRLWCTYIAFAIVFILPLFLVRSLRWTYLLNALLDIWLIGNLVYFRSYGDVLNRWLLLNWSAMDGVWGSVFTFLRPCDLIYPFLSIVWIIILERFSWVKSERRYWMSSFVGIISFFLLLIPSVWVRESHAWPWSKEFSDISMGRLWYVKSYSPIGHFVNEVIALGNSEDTFVPIQDEEIASYILPQTPISDSTNLLVIFVESWEEWTLDEQLVGSLVLPQIKHLCESQYTSTFSVIPNVSHGKSSDAQLIVFTGLLPIYNGATAMRYSNNVYPSWVKLSDAKTKQIFIPTESGAWNQGAMSRAYGFHALYADEVNDSVLVDTVIHAIQSCDRPFILVHTTMASHAPFMVNDDYPQLAQTNELDNNRIQYLRCLGYTDRQIGREINTILSDSLLSKSTRVLIIGDHPIFNLTNKIPMVWYDPTTKAQVRDKTLCQIDVYRHIIQNMHIQTQWIGLNHNDRDISNRFILSNYGEKICQ